MVVLKKRTHPVRMKSNSQPLSNAAKSARLFRSGANQAVRIPREFELPSAEVMIRQVAGTLVIEPVQRQHSKGSPAALLAALATLELIADPFPNVDDGLNAQDQLAHQRWFDEVVVGIAPVQAVEPVAAVVAVAVQALAAQQLAAGGAGAATGVIAPSTRPALPWPATWSRR